MIRRPPRSTQIRSSAASDVYKRQSYYSGDKPTKFGIYPERLDEAIAVARSYDLTIDTIHFHVSHHLLDDDLPAFERAVAAAAAMARRVIAAGCPLREVNAGGGLGAVMRQGQRPLDLDAYTGILAEHFGPLGVTIACEPGEIFSRNAAVLLAEVVTVEDRSAAGDGSAVFAGLTCGWNVMNLAFIYKEFVETVLCRAADAPRTASYTLTSHINEGPDIFAEDYPCLLYTSDAADDLLCVDLGVRRIIKKKTPPPSLS